MCIGTIIDKTYADAQSKISNSFPPPNTATKSIPKAPRTIISVAKKKNQVLASQSLHKCLFIHENSPKNKVDRYGAI